MINYIRLEETRNRMSNSHVGKHHSEETKLKISIGNKGKHGEVRTEETKRLMRVSAIKRIKDNRLGGGQLTPSYNPKSIPIIEEFGKANGYNFQHAENGGEFHIKELGY